MASRGTYLAEWFSPEQVEKGGVARRRRVDVDRYTSMETVLLTARAVGFPVIETAGQVIVVFEKDAAVRVHR